MRRLEEQILTEKYRRIEGKLTFSVQLAELQISKFLTRMQHLGYQKDDSIRLLLAKKEENS